MKGCENMSVKQEELQPGLQPEKGFNILGFRTTIPQLIIFLIGPALYFSMFFLPFGDTTSQGGLGIILWTAWYWSTGVVPTGYCIVIPLLGTAFLPGMDWGFITQTLIHPVLGMLLGPALIICMWSRWGFTRRLSLLCLKWVGTSVRAQALVWLMLGTIGSCFAANVVIAIALTPVALEVLRNVGYDSSQKLKAGKSSMLIIIAVGVGSSLGGILTPMAGGQAAISWATVCEAIGETVSVGAWLSRMALPVFLSIIPCVLLFGYVFPVDKKQFEGSAGYFDQELKKLGPISKSEFLGVLMFFLALLLPFLQPLWAPFIPEGVKIEPPLIFTIVTLILCIIPAPDAGAKIKPLEYVPGERLLSTNACKIFPMQAFLIWPTAMSIAVLVNETGASQLFANFLGPYWDMTPYVGVGLFVAFSLLLAQPASDTGAAGILAPVILTACVAAGQNAVPWLMMMGYTVNLSFCVPTATGTIALPIALEGKVSWRLPAYGAACAIGTGLVAWLFWGYVFAHNLTFWMNF